MHEHSLSRARSARDARPDSDPHARPGAQSSLARIKRREINSSTYVRLQLRLTTRRPPRRAIFFPRLTDKAVQPAHFLIDDGTPSLPFVELGAG